jgi:hypothetical protein
LSLTKRASSSGVAAAPGRSTRATLSSASLANASETTPWAAASATAGCAATAASTAKDEMLRPLKRM